MAHGIERLSARAVATKNKPGMYADGGGLYLKVAATGARSWVFRYMTDGRAHNMGLGPLHTVTLAEARDKARQQRRLRLDGQDPLAARRGARDQARLNAAKTMTFRQCAEAYIASHSAGWKNPKHAAQWPATLGAYVYPVFGDLPVADIDTALVMRAIQPVWNEKPETASRLRGRIESVLGWATTSGYRAGDNPARWRGHLSNLLPAPTKAKAAVRRERGRKEHHAALPYVEMGAFMADLRQQEGLAARAMEFLILTAARTGEVIGATWQEIDLEGRLWTVPGERMKAGKEHRVPLSDAALAILRALPKGEPGDRVFPLSNMALLMLLRRMKRDDLTAHGFRSTFRDWAAERTNFPAEVAEMALAHVVGDKVEAAYRRGDLFAKRRQLAEAWAKFCAAAPAMAAMAASDKVVAIRATV